MNLRWTLARTHFREMETATNTGGNWVQELVEFLRTQRQNVTLASYDLRMIDAARALGIPIAAI